MGVNKLKEYLKLKELYTTCYEDQDIYLTEFTKEEIKIGDKYYLVYEYLPKLEYLEVFNVIRIYEKELDYVDKFYVFIDEKHYSSFEKIPVILKRVDIKYIEDYKNIRSTNATRIK